MYGGTCGAIVTLKHGGYMKHFKIFVETWDGTQVFFAATNTKDSRALAFVEYMREQMEDGEFTAHDGDPDDGSVGTLKFHIQKWDGTNQKDRMSNISAKDAIRVQGPKNAPSLSATSEAVDIA
jgi:hypothetical protein